GRTSQPSSSGWRNARSRDYRRLRSSTRSGERGMEGSIRRVYLNAYNSIGKHIRMKTTSSVETAALNHKGHERQLRMKLLSAIILTILLFHNPARAEVNPIILV